MLSLSRPSRRWCSQAENLIMVASFCTTSSYKPPDIAITIGSTNSYVGVMEGNKPKIIQKIPSLVRLTTANEPISGFTRLLGKKFNDPIIQKAIKMSKTGFTLPYKIIRAPNGESWLEISDGVMYSPSHMMHILFKKLKSAAESYLGNNVYSALITFPAAWLTVAELNATLAGAHEAGLHNNKFAHEFACAMLAHGLIFKEGVYAIVDLGGRTFDVTFFTCRHIGVESNGGPMCRFNIIGQPKRDMFLGGEDFDNVVMDYLASKLKGTDLGIDFAKDSFYLRQIAEQVKMQLSSLVETEINVPYLTSNDAGGREMKHVSLTFTRLEFESLVSNLVERIIDHCEMCLDDAGIKGSYVDEVILVGGMASVPIVKRVVSEIFGKKPFTRTGLKPDEAVALGAIGSLAERRCFGILLSLGTAKVNQSTDSGDHN